MSKEDIRLFSDLTCYENVKTSCQKNVHYGFLDGILRTSRCRSEEARLDTIREEYQLIRDALRLRGIGTLAHPSEMLEYRMVPLLTELVQVGNELSASAMTRGLDAPNKRTNVCRSGFHTQDTIAFVFCAVVIMLFIISKVLGL